MKYCIFLPLLISQFFLFTIRSENVFVKAPKNSQLTIRSQSNPRDFKHVTTSKEKEDIRYIVITLATGSWVELWKERSSLKKAGDRIDHLHPLKFLQCVFTDEELKSGFHAINGNGGKVWREFFGGLAGSLSEESQRDNITASQIKDFAKKVKVHVHSIIDPIERESWNEFIDTLLEKLPRTGNPGKYDQ